MADETVTNSVHSAADPLSGLPSILALRDLHRRRTVSQPTASDDAHRRTMLRLDPPLAMRALRMAAAPVFGAHQDAWTLARIADALGPSLLERACDTPLVDVVGTAPLRQLWLHALATAHAAERLAAASGVMPPDEAYLLGLLHDAPTWTHWIALRQNGAPLATKPQKRPVATLPPAIATVLERAADLYRRGAAATDAGPAGLLAAAELLAEAAGFLHPGQDAAALVDSAPLLLDAAAAEADGTILGYSAVVDRLKAGDRRVTALIEVRISPERDGGFDRLARRISKFDQVRDCFLMSGGYDLAVIVEGKDLLDVATFVSEKLSTLGGVLSTATRFELKAYKENGFLANGGGDEERLPVAP